MLRSKYSGSTSDHNWARQAVTHPAHPLAALIDRRQWVAHRAKRPIDPNTGRAASTTDPATWGTYDVAVGMVTAGRADGIGFVFSPDDPYSGIDVDGCRNAETGEIDARGRALIDRLPGIYWETSLSGTGLHGIGRGVLPDAAGGRHRKGIGIFDRARFFVMTGHVLPGHETLGDFGDGLIALYQDVAPAPPERHVSPAPTLPLDDHDLCERLTHETGSKGSRLLAGDRAGYSDFSSARFALATKAFFYSDDVDQIARVIRSSGLFKDGDSERERDRKALVDARQATTSYSGPRYDPTYRSNSPAPLHADTTTATDTPSAVPPDSDDQSCSDQLRSAQARIAELEATIVTRERVIERERERRIAAEERADRLALERSQAMQVLRAPDLNPGEKLTQFATIIDLGSRIANGEKPTPHGFASPAIRVAEMTGQKVKAVRRHRNDMAERKIIQKQNVRERTEKDTVDPETGEIMAVTGMRDMTYIHVPENNIIHLVTPALAYSRPDDAPQRGGKRRPVCKEHPDAGTVTKWHLECAECRVVLDQGKTDHAPEPRTEIRSGSTLGPETPVANTVLRVPISGPELTAANSSTIGDSSGPKFDSEPNRSVRRQPLLTPPSDPWNPPPGWEDERRRFYGDLYKGVS